MALFAEDEESAVDEGETGFDELFVDGLGMFEHSAEGPFTVALDGVADAPVVFPGAAPEAVLSGIVGEHDVKTTGAIEASAGKRSLPTDPQHNRRARSGPW